MDAAAKLEMLDWLKNELSASNDIIGILLHRLRSLGDPGEYDPLFAAVEKRRQLWEPIIHPEFFPRYGIDDELQQSLSGRRPPPPHPLQHIVLSPPSPSPRRPPPAQSLNHRAVIPPSPPPRRPPPVQPLNHRDLLPPSPSPRPSSFVPSHHGHNANHRPDPSRPAGKIVASTPMLYTTREIIDGKPVNTVEGLKVYEELIDVTQIQKILSFANEKKDNFRRAGLTVGQTVILNKRPLRCHGSLSIQLGAPIVEGHIQDKNQRETRVEAVPGFLQDLFDRFFQQGIVPSKPDYCVIDFYLEGEYCRPHQYPPWYGRPLCTLCLTECDMVCGGVIRGERGDARGPLQLSLSRGSLVVLQGRSADVAQRCIPSSQKQRVLLTFGKSLPRESPEPTAEPCPVPRSDGMHRQAIAPVPVAAAAIPFPAAVPLATTACSCRREASPRPVTHRLPGLASSCVGSSTSTIV